MYSLAIDNPVSWDLARTFTGTTPTDERIEHQIEELVGKLEAHALRASCRFAGERIEAPGQIAVVKELGGVTITRGT